MHPRSLFLVCCFKAMINSRQTCRLSVRTLETKGEGGYNLKQDYFTDPEDSIDLTFEIDDEANVVNLKCAVQNIYPLPGVKLLCVQSDFVDINILVNSNFIMQIQQRGERRSY